jgi:hypothetical protein
MQCARLTVARQLCLVAVLIAAAIACRQNPAAPEPPAVVTRLDPDGLVPLSDQPWVALNTSGWGYLRRTSAKDADIVTDPTAPFSPPHVLRMIFTPSMSPDSEPSVHWIRLAGPREVYARWWMKLSANWKGSPAGGGKIAFLWPRDGVGVVYTNIAGSSAPHHINLATTWEPYGYRFWEPNVATTVVGYDRWYRIDWYARWSSAPAADDGILRWGVDGVLNADYANVRWPDGAAGFWQFEFAATLQKPPIDEQYMYIDHVSVSTR